MKVSAIVLAGAPNNGKLEAAFPQKYEALIPLQGRPLVAWVVEALAASGQVEEIIVVGPQAQLQEALGADWPPKGKIVQSADTLLGNLQLGAAASGERLLVVTSDLPLLKPEIVDDFLTKAERADVSLYYPIVSREDTFAMFPEAERTFIRLKDGTFTGGNLVYMEKSVLSQMSGLFQQVIAARKKPWRLVKILGGAFILSFLLRTLSIAKIERRAQELGLNAKAVIMRQPEVGFDVDKPQDFTAIVRALEDFNRP